MILGKLQLWCVEQRLKLHLGKYNAYLNQVFDHKAQNDLLQRLVIARQLLQEPELELGRRWLEAVRVRNRLIPRRLSKQADQPDHDSKPDDVHQKQAG